MRLYGGRRAIQVDGAAGVAHNHGREAQPSCVERGVAHAIVVGKPGKEHTRQPALAQIAGQAGWREPVVLIERGIGIDLRLESLAQDQLRLRQVKTGVKIRAWLPLHAMRRPQRLLAVGKLDRFKGLFAGVRGRERSMICRMPVLRENDVIKMRRDALDRRNHFIPAGHGQRSARTKIVLHVGHDQNVI